MAAADLGVDAAAAAATFAIEGRVQGGDVESFMFTCSDKTLSECRERCLFGAPLSLRR